MPNDHYSGRTAPLTSKRCILYIYSTNIGTEYFKHVVYSSFFSLQNAVCFIILTYLVSCIIHILYTGCAKIKKKNNSGARRLMHRIVIIRSFRKYLKQVVCMVTTVLRMVAGVKKTVSRAEPATFFMSVAPLILYTGCAKIKKIIPAPKG